MGNSTRISSTVLIVTLAAALAFPGAAVAYSLTQESTLPLLRFSYTKGEWDTNGPVGVRVYLDAIDDVPNLVQKDSTTVSLATWAAMFARSVTITGTTPGAGETWHIWIPQPAGQRVVVVQPWYTVGATKLSIPWLTIAPKFLCNPQARADVTATVPGSVDVTGTVGLKSSTIASLTAGGGSQGATVAVGSLGSLDTSGIDAATTAGALFVGIGICWLVLDLRRRR